MEEQIKKTFTCAKCKETFESGWSDEEALQEKDQIFPDITIDKCEVICDDCFNEIMGLN